MTASFTNHRLPNGNHEPAGGSGQFRRAYPAHSNEAEWIAADGWKLRHFYWPSESAPPRGSLLFLTGRADFYEKYLETFADFHARGWGVTTFDWRGQAGSGRLGRSHDVAHISDFSVWVDDLAEFYSQWQGESDGPHVILGHSMGGHILMRALQERRVAPDAAILSAPMLMPRRDGTPAWVAQLVARIMARLGPEDRQAWKVSEKPLEAQMLRQRLITHDDARYSDESWWLAQRAELRSGPPSWRWVERAYASARRFHDTAALAQVKVPLLVLGTRVDELVDLEMIEQVAQAVPGARLHLLDDARHEILRETDPIRDKVMQTMFEFLDEVVPAA